MIFGLASWIFHLWERDSDKNSFILKEIFHETRNKLCINIEDFTNIFLDSHDFNVEDFWGWNNWELQEKEEWDDDKIRILEKLEKFYAINSLISLQDKSNVEIEKIRLPHNRSLAYLAEGTRDLIKVLDDIESNPKNWRFVLNDKAVNKVQMFKILLEKARQEQEDEDLKRKRETNVSKEEINKFKENIVKDFYNNSTLRNILKYYNLYKDESDKEYRGNLNKLGISTLFDKAAFFDDKVKWHVLFFGTDNGFDFGRRMANGENNEILERIEKKCTQIDEKEFETKLREIGTPDNSIIIATNSAIWKFLEKNTTLHPQRASKLSKIFDRKK